MSKAARSVFVFALVLAACNKTADDQPTDDTSSGRASGGAGGQRPRGTGGSPASGTGGQIAPGTGGTNASGGAAGASPMGSGGESGAAGAIGSGGEGPDAAAPGTGGSSDAGAAADDSGSGPAPSGDVIGWYEAETNQITGRAVKATCTACPSRATMKPGDACCSAGGQVQWLVAHGNGELQFNAVAAPSDGMYDVTWWYYCAKNDNFGDKNCGGQTDPPTTPAGCRPHQFYVNGTLLPGAYHFPCFGDHWDIVRAATVSMPLKAGNANTIKLHAPPPRDSVNVDAIAIMPAGKGLPPLIKSVADLTGH